MGDFLPIRGPAGVDLHPWRDSYRLERREQRAGASRSGLGSGPSQSSHRILKIFAEGNRRGDMTGEEKM
jgi:hypothetical protein